MKPSDAVWAAPLWRATQKATKGFGTLKMAYTEDVVRMNIEHKGQRMYGHKGKLGFFLCKTGWLPNAPSALSASRPPGTKAAQLVIWVVRRRLPEKKYRAVLSEIAAGWLEDEIKRGEWEWGFGEMPVVMADRTRRWLDDWGIHVTEYEHAGAKWRRYWFRMADAIGKLP